jgi:phosphoribosylglycinamide formyltransferase-1
VSEFRLGILVSGRGTNLQAIIDSIEKEELPASISLVISNKINAQALERCTRHGIESKSLNPKDYSNKDEFDKALAELFLKNKIDLICLAGYMRILGKSFIKNFEGKIINIHPSLLPAFPGLHPQQQAIEAGVKFSGCTVHFVNEEVDEGPIILQSTVPVKDSDNSEELSQRILEQEHIIYPQAIRLFLENRLTISGRRVLCKKD